jgi:LAGLIDADG-like domain
MFISKFLNIKMFGKYAHGKLIPEWVQDAPKEFIQEFINGYIKADGSINSNGRITLTTVSYDLAFGLQRLYLKLGFICSTNRFTRPLTIIEGRTEIICIDYTLYTIHSIGHSAWDTVHGTQCMGHTYHETILFITYCRKYFFIEKEIILLVYEGCL